jgi:DNA-binding response OmpR family regulator
MPTGFLLFERLRSVTMPPARTTVLIVDDDADHLAILDELLSEAGFRTLTAASCAEAVRILAKARVDVLVADLSLGDGTAIDLMRAIGPNKPPVAIVFSGRDDAYDVTRSLAVGYDAHLGKPTPIHVLVAMIGRFLARTKSGMRLAQTVPPGQKKSSA